ncbi:unnamed protein product [Cyprideis torosa]|uniref:Uncharacterized protein n=1 Tax=Cyprideis torosa TaxID=163714 RepID=A0A7R8WA15_9CRUS|nr:unnamed protein product [Cyprideis torosa]CAG0890467.1 unnamed protein product [Cyprideis torosa]
MEASREDKEEITDVSCTSVVSTTQRFPTVSEDSNRMSPQPCSQDIWPNIDSNHSASRREDVPDIKMLESSASNGNVVIDVEDDDEEENDIIVLRVGEQQKEIEVMDICSDSEDEAMKVNDRSHEFPTKQSDAHLLADTSLSIPNTPLNTKTSPVADTSTPIVNTPPVPDTLSPVVEEMDSHTAPPVSNKPQQSLLLLPVTYPKPSSPELRQFHRYAIEGKTTQMLDMIREGVIESIDARDDECGWTAAMLVAICNQHPRVFDFLLEQKTNLTIYEIGGLRRSGFDMAALQWPNRGCLRLLGMTEEEISVIGLSCRLSWLRNPSKFPEKPWPPNIQKFINDFVRYGIRRMPHPQGSNAFRTELSWSKPKNGPNQLTLKNCRNDQGQFELFKAIVSKKPISKIAELIESGGLNQRINEPDKNGCTALMYAAMSSYHSAVALLLDRGADTSLKNSRGKSVQDFAAKSRSLHTLSMILGRNFDSFKQYQNFLQAKIPLPNEDTSSSETLTTVKTVQFSSNSSAKCPSSVPSCCSKPFPDVVATPEPASVKSEILSDSSCSVFNGPVQSTSTQPLPSSNSHPPQLSEQSSSVNPQSFKKSLSSNAQVGPKKRSKKNLLGPSNLTLKSCRNDQAQFEFFRAIVSKEPISKIADLIDSGGLSDRINEPDTNGRTALMYAASCAYPSLVQLLLKRGADRSLRDSNGKSAFDHAFMASKIGSMSLILGRKVFSFKHYRKLRKASKITLPGEDIPSPDTSGEVKTTKSNSDSSIECPSNVAPKSDVVVVPDVSSESTRLVFTGPVKPAIPTQTPTSSNANPSKSSEKSPSTNSHPSSSQQAPLTNRNPQSSFNQHPSQSPTQVASTNPEIIFLCQSSKPSSNSNLESFKLLPSTNPHSQSFQQAAATNQQPSKSSKQPPMNFLPASSTPGGHEHPTCTSNSRESVMGIALDDRNAGYRLLVKSGWVAGTGLGKNRDGRSEPVPVPHQQNRRGIGHPGVSEPPSKSGKRDTAKEANRKRRQKERNKWNCSGPRQLERVFETRLMEKIMERRYRRELDGL